MLDVIVDNRSGSKLELVFLVYNEAKRLPDLLKHYGARFDIVLMDGGSTDATVSLAREAGATVFRRTGPDFVGENHFVHYVNNVTKSGYCFYMFADEYVEISDLDHTLAQLKLGSHVVLGNRVDWFYGIRSNSPCSTTPRGMAKGTAIYNPSHLHASLEYDKSLMKVDAIHVHHLHLWSMRQYFGTAGAYAYTEVEQFRKSNRPVWKFVRRFVISEFLMLPRKLWRERKASGGFLLWLCVISCAIPLLGLLALIEQKFLKSPDEQLKLYAKFYEK
jgi:glycosyltransferase involved in cell wall biosynthesis